MKIDLTDIVVRFRGAARPLFAMRQFALPETSRLLIYGPSGCGKSSFLHLIAGLLVPDRGEVRIDGRDLVRLPDGERSRLRRTRMGIVFQSLNLIEHLTACENVLLALPPGTKEAHRKAVESLDRLGMSAHLNAYAAQLSLGQKQRIAVARVLAARPPLILADEPTSSVDEDNARVVLEALVEAVADDGSLLMVSHDMRARALFKVQRPFLEMVTV